MKAGSRGATDTKERFGMRRALVVAQVALSLVLVVGAVLFVRSLRNLMTLDAGFQQEGILVVNMDLRRTGIPEERRSAVFAEITSRVAALPGVASAAQAFIVPVSGSGWNNNIVIDGSIDYATVSKALTAALNGKAITVKGQSVTLRSVLRSSAAARSSRRVSRYWCGASPKVRRNSRLKCAGDRRAARAKSTTVSGSK